MGKVISLSDFKNMTTNRKSSLKYKGLEKYIRMLTIQRGIIEELCFATDDFLKEVNFPVTSFTLDEESARNFVSADLIEAFAGGEELLYLSYIAHIDGVEYRTMAEAQFDENEIEFLVSLYKKSGKEWLVYVGDDSWERGPGENFF